jgi:hypothetical protein
MANINRNPIIIETRNLSKNYDGIEALKNLNLRVRKIQFLVFSDLMEQEKLQQLNYYWV